MIHCPSCGRHILEGQPCPFCQKSSAKLGRVPRSVAALCSAWLVACYGPAPGYKDSDSGFDTGPDVTDLTASVTWGADNVTLTLTNASDSYWWGIAETDPATADPWTGEDCLYGYGKYNYCHPVSASTLTLAYGAKPDTVVEGETTVFNSPDFAKKATYSLWDASSTNCIGTWGQDTSYYAGYCETLE